MIIDVHEKLDVCPAWFEKQVRDALEVTTPDVVEKLKLPRLCELLAIYKVRNEDRAKEAAERMKALVDSSLIDSAME